MSKISGPFFPRLGVIFVFFAALLPRLYGLGSFLTIDEVKWAEGAARFLSGLYTADFSQTYWHFFPGTTITWGSALILGATCLTAPDGLTCANAHVENLADWIGWLRLSPVLLTSVGVVGIYLLIRRLVDHRLALLTALLLAFDPFFIAHSRILNGDAGAAILMNLTVFAFLSCWLGNTLTDAPAPTSTRWGLLLLSGVLAGLALLTKLPAPVIGLFIGGLGLTAVLLAWPVVGVTALWRWTVALGIWGSVALLTFVLLWPAMWVAPLETLRLMYVDAFEIGEVGSGHDAFFRGQILADPGPWFYPIAIAFRLTPVVSLGLLLLLIGLPVYLISLVRGRSTTLRPGPYFSSHAFRWVLWTMLAFIIFIILLANVSPKKLDRYVMAVIPALIFLAAFGLIQVALWLRTGLGPRWASLWLIGAISLQFLAALFATPYYLNYYNPLLGGSRQAAAQVPVGWGEGLEQAAHYLNSLPDAESLAVSSWYSDIFRPYFVGQSASFSDDGRAQLAADYVVFYVNQMQRAKPYTGLVDYFRADPSALVLSIAPDGQILTDAAGPQPHWVEVYKAPAARSAGGAPTVEGVAQLLAYDVVGGDSAGSPLVTADEVTITLFLRVLGPLPEGTTLAASLVSADQTVQTDDWQIVERRGEWQEGHVVEWIGAINPTEPLPSGDYRLKVAFQFEDGSPIADFPISEQDPPLRLE